MDPLWGPDTTLGVALWRGSKFYRGGGHVIQRRPRGGWEPSESRQSPELFNMAFTAGLRRLGSCIFTSLAH